MNNKSAQITELICCSNVMDPNWHWLEHRFADKSLKWQFYHTIPQNFIEKKLRRPDLKYPRAAWEAVLAAKKVSQGVLITHGPIISFYTALFSKLIGNRLPQIAYTFNFTALPQGIRRSLMQYAYPYADRFVVYSTMEKHLYSRWFKIPEEKFDVVLWGVDRPEVTQPDVPIVTGRYICAIGEFQRDYGSLIEAMRTLPEVQLVVVARPHNFKGIDLPANVKLYENLPLGETLNILKFSQFMVLPLKGSEIPCGHTTLVYSMHLGVPFLITKSSGIEDYIQEGVNGISYPYGEPAALVEKIKELWSNPELCHVMGQNGLAFAMKNCSEDNVAAHFANYLDEQEKKNRI